MGVLPVDKGDEKEGRRTGIFVRPSFPSQTLLNEQSTAWAG